MGRAAIRGTRERSQEGRAFRKGAVKVVPCQGERSKMRTNEYNGCRNTEVKVTFVGQSGEVVGPDMHRYFL